MLMPCMGVRIGRVIRRMARMRCLIGVVGMVVPRRVVLGITPVPIGQVVLIRVRGPVVLVRGMPELRSRVVRMAPCGVACGPDLRVCGVCAVRTVVSAVPRRASRVNGTCRLRAACVVIAVDRRVMHMARPPVRRRRVGVPGVCRGRVRGVATRRARRAGRSVVIVPACVTRRVGGPVGRARVGGMVVLMRTGYLNRH
jgi:hypothetical protein